jgi:nucleotidyltransferase substrate binding protein (TIGR01987 family)
MSEDIRWVQRLHNWNRALAQLSKFMQQETLNELEEQGLIQSFEYNHELAWKTQKDFLQNSGYTDLFGSKDVARKAFEVGLVTDGQLWMDMIKSRNLSSHTYNEETTNKIITAIVEHYYKSFCGLNTKLNEMAQSKQDDNNDG